MMGVTEPLLLLHGFTQTGHGWDEVVAHLAGETYRPLAVDLPGHGAAGARRPIDMDTCMRDVAGLTDGSFTLAGYSMGGRIALHVALAVPERVSRLVLVSTTAGIENPAQRAARRVRDDELAGWMARHTIEQIADRWGSQPLFAGQGPEVSALARADRLRNDPEHLAAALRGIGTGVMRPLWEHVPALAMPVVVLAGEGDAKFVALGRRLADTMPSATLVVVPGAGHALTLEAPGAVAAAIESG